MLKNATQLSDSKRERLRRKEEQLLEQARAKLKQCRNSAEIKEVKSWLSSAMAVIRGRFGLGPLCWHAIQNLGRNMSPPVSWPQTNWRDRPLTIELVRQTLIDLYGRLPKFLNHEQDQELRRRLALSKTNTSLDYHLQNLGCSRQSQKLSEQTDALVERYVEQGKNVETQEEKEMLKEQLLEEVNALRQRSGLPDTNLTNINNRISRLGLSSPRRPSILHKPRIQAER